MAIPAVSVHTILAFRTTVTVPPWVTFQAALTGIILWNTLVIDTYLILLTFAAKFITFVVSTLIFITRFTFRAFVVLTIITRSAVSAFSTAAVIPAFLAIAVRFARAGTTAIILTNSGTHKIPVLVTTAWHAFANALLTSAIRAPGHAPMVCGTIIVVAFTIPSATPVIHAVASAATAAASVGTTLLAMAVGCTALALIAPLPRTARPATATASIRAALLAVTIGFAGEIAFLWMLS